MISDINIYQLRRLDLTLLLVFAELMRQRKLTLVAQRLGLTQSAISHSLKRLRDVFDDELFLRRPNGVEPTARARALEPRIADIIAMTQDALKIDDSFDPATDSRLIRIGAPDYETAAFAGPLTKVLRKEAPAMRVSFRSVFRKDALDQLADNELDIALGYFLQLSDRYVRDQLLSETFAVVARRNHPKIREPLSLKTYLASEHLLMSIGGDLHGVVDSVLERRGLSRNVVAAVPQFLPALATVAETDLILTVSRRVAERYGPRFSLRILEPPFAVPQYVVSMVVHRRAERDKAVTWVLDKLRALASD